MPSNAVVRLNVGGRPSLELDTRLIYDLASIHCTMEDIARIMRCSVDTLERGYAELIKDGRASGRSSLRRKQYQLAMDGHPTMLVWLGKQLLGQRDKFDATFSNPDGSALGSKPPPAPTTVEEAERQYSEMCAALPPAETVQ